MSLLHAATYATRIMGRHVVEEKTGAILVDWPGVRLDFSGITGTSSVSMRMNGNWSVFGYRVVEEESSNDGYPNAVNDDDDEDMLVLVTKIFQADYPLSLSNGSTQLDPSKTYKVSIWKRDDPLNNGATINGLVVSEGGKGRHKKKADAKFHEGKKNRKLIEFVGDSDTVGFGIRGSKSSMWYFLLCQAFLACQPSLRKATDVTKSWAHLVASKLQADYHVIAWSGAGAKYSFEIPDNMIDMYNRMLASDERTSVEPKDVTFFGPSPDAVVVYLGQNDAMHLERQSRVEEKLEEAFITLLSKIRLYRPSPIPIVIVVPASDAKPSCITDEKKCKKVAERQKNVWESSVHKFAKLEKGDPHVYVIENRHEPNDLVLDSPKDFGMCLHWNVSSNQKWAAGLEPKLRQVLKWT